jgi:uncharacterized membrane protein
VEGRWTTRLGEGLRRYLVAGVLAFAPLGITIWAVAWIIVARHLFGGELVRAWENLLARVPVARNIYSGVKQLFEAIFRQSDQSQFNRVVLIEYPRRGIHAIAFTTGPASGQLAVLDGKAMVNCFLPTTPNPTSGYYLLVPEEDLQEVDLSVEDAFKLVMSAGLVAPSHIGVEPGSSEAARAAVTAAEIRSVPAPK